ncbi:MAG TPA: autotransporter outer membrane beta-barrel domain-containing protein [Bradyrhizobium sp.]|jgi:hypothetical protein
MRFWLGLSAVLLSIPTLAQERAAVDEPLANRIAATTEALSQYRSLDNGIWSGASLGHINDSRPGFSRVVDVRSLQIGYDYRIVSPFTANDQLVLGLAGGVLNAAARLDAQNTHIDSHGWSVTGYGVYAPFIFLSFPVAISVGRWSSDQTRTGTPLMPIYSASYDSTSFASSVGAALTLPVSRFLLTTSFSHRYSDNNRPAYDEAINPAATDFQTTPAEVTDSSQLVGNMRLALPFETGRLWTSVGYAYDLQRLPAEDTRSEYPLGIGLDLLSPRWQLSAAGQLVLRHDITTYTGSLTGRLQF